MKHFPGFMPLGVSCINKVNRQSLLLSLHSWCLLLFPFFSLPPPNFSQSYEPKACWNGLRTSRTPRGSLLKRPLFWDHIFLVSCVDGDSVDSRLLDSLIMLKPEPWLSKWSIHIIISAFETLVGTLNRALGM